MYKNQPEVHALFVQMHQTMKKVGKIKYKEKELLSAQKQVEHDIDKCWGPALDRLEKMIDSYGFEVVRLLRKKKPFIFCPSMLTQKIEGTL